MSKIQFEVSAKTARLIGRENISGVDGAVIELIKNSYDADATCAFILFDMPFPKIPHSISYDIASQVLGSELPSLLSFYYDNGGGFEKKLGLSIEEEHKLQSFLFSKNSIYIIDNGIGMNEYTLKHSWMNIGTSDKEDNRISPKGRAKTGAKGIGRFALDKLSVATTVNTQSENDVVYSWAIDWDQFENAELLNEVSASLEILDGSFSERIITVLKEHLKGYENYEWSSGTIIKLTPTREAWSEELFKKVNENLKSLFPSSSDSQFDIYISNIYYPKYNFYNQRFSLDSSEYDYKIIGKFDGEDTITVEILRNEVDISKRKITIGAGNTHAVQLSEFWARNAFKKDGYRKKDYIKQFNKTISAQETLKIESNKLLEIGPFSVELYFIKNTPSTFAIVKPINANNRKGLLESFSGIKLYRDGFKVRPYGEKGNGYDWLGLSIRAQKSPAAVSHDSGAWKVRLNQLIGEVRISQQNNPNLEDMANREGLVQNDAYSNFIKIIIKMIETFEVDRQYIFREYSKWKKEEEEKISVVSSVVQQVKEEMQTDKTNQVNNKEPSLNNRDFTADDYKNAIVKLDQERQAQELTNKLLMLYSSSGVMTSTFSHEIEGIRSKIGSRMQHLRASVRRVVGEYDGIEAFNPYTIMSSIEETDNLIDCWLGVLMNGARGNVIATERINIYKYIQKCIELWKPLLQTKRIAIILTQNDYELDEYLYKVAEIDLLIIINNFLLNSAYFLELGNISHREVTIRIEVKQSLIKLHMDNNGPPLDRVFYDNPDRIFEAGVSTKTIKTDNGLKKGSGIGLWIMRTVVHSLSGEIHCKDLKEGFGIEISLPK